MNEFARILSEPSSYAGIAGIVGGLSVIGSDWKSGASMIAAGILAVLMKERPDSKR